MIVQLMQLVVNKEKNLNKNDKAKEALDMYNKLKG